MPHHSPLDEPHIANHAWSRFRRQLRVTAWLALIADIAMLGGTFLAYGMVSIHLYIGIGLALPLAIFLFSALMGLVFLSSGTGHDHAVADQREFRRKR
ncbi:MAG TPA: hypothetical protein VLA37_08900 [Sphingomonadaceae bacterium]|nr:hypothetical protein [Sphingomonadaceae bacterium]